MYSINSLVGAIIGLMLLYLAITLIVGAKKVYFDTQNNGSDEQK